MAFKQEGLTSFVVEDKQRSFRFRVSVADDKLQMWLEDTETKQQWHTTDMSMTEYVGTEQAIPNAKSTDYAEDFAKCLGATPSALNAMYERTLGPADKSGGRTLTLVLLAVFAARKARFVYPVTLLPVALDRTDVLAARVRDLEDEKKRLKQRDEALVTVRTIGAAAPEEALQWELRGVCEAGSFQLQDEGRTIQVVSGGRYLISLHFSPSKAIMFDVKFNGETDRTLWDSGAENRQLTLSFVARVPAKTQLQIVNKGTHPSATGNLVTIAAI